MIKDRGPILSGGLGMRQDQSAKFRAHSSSINTNPLSVREALGIIIFSLSLSSL